MIIEYHTLAKGVVPGMIRVVSFPNMIGPFEVWKPDLTTYDPKSVPEIGTGALLAAGALALGRKK
jgi:hypothetical protein